jgi:hypothetical protein
MISKNPQMRKRYDRHEALADPGRAVRRAATEAAVQSVVGLGKGLFDVGALAVDAIKSRASAITVGAVANNANRQKQNQRSKNSGNDTAEDATATIAAIATPPSSSPQKLLP